LTEIQHDARAIWLLLLKFWGKARRSDWYANCILDLPNSAKKN